MTDYDILLHEEAYRKAAVYLQALQEGNEQAGGRLQATWPDGDWRELAVPAFIAQLLNSKRPRLFAESEVVGDGQDWNLSELSILGDIVAAVPVMIFDDGRHQHPAVHECPFEGVLLYVPGALLRNDNGRTAADWDEVTANGGIDFAAYAGLYERRLLPALVYANDRAAARNRAALITIPGIGCGQFAGPFRGQLGPILGEAISRILERHQRRLAHVRAVYYDPYGEAENERREFGRMSFLVRPLRKGNEDKPQLCPPVAYEEEGDDFGGCDLFSLVAWDQVSWPGNDFYGGSRATDDGVKAAATDSMKVITGAAGSYNKLRYQYEPPDGYNTWLDVVHRRQIRLEISDNLFVLAEAEGEIFLRQVADG